MTTVPDLPPPGVQSGEDRRQMSRIFIAQAREELADMIDRVEGLLPYLIQLTITPPRPFTITGNTQLRRLRRLTGNDSLEIGDVSPVGFSINH